VPVDIDMPLKRVTPTGGHDVFSSSFQSSLWLRDKQHKVALDSYFKTFGGTYQ